ncbi:MAG: lamin tail domain-containing protein, partial [Verrucomicrobia bacterium]|nr:lamin tail domain-containing protein [Verrucomicrobiota bacterium]
MKFGEDLYPDTAYPGEYDTYHILMTKLNRNAFEARSVCSEDQVDMTLISSDGDIVYNCGLRLRGSGSRIAVNGNYRIEIPNGLEFKGREELNMNWENAIAQYIGMTLTKNANAIASDVKLVRVMMNESLKPGTVGGGNQGIYCRIEGVDNDYIENHLPGTEIGNFYTADGSDACRPSHTGTLTWSPSIASYMTAYSPRINNPYTAWYDIQEMTDYIADPISAYPTLLSNRVNIAQWARLFAANICLDNAEAGYFAIPGSGDELRVYMNPDDQLGYLFPWDYSDVVGMGGSPGTRAALWGYTLSIIDKYLYNRPMVGLYVGDTWNMINNTMSAANLTTLFDSMGSKMAPLKATTLSKLNTQRNGLNALINTNLVITGVTSTQPAVMVTTTNVGTTLPVPNVNQNVGSGQWVSLGSMFFPGAGEELARVTRTKAGRAGSGFLTIADAVMFSNATHGVTIIDDGDVGFTRTGTWVQQPSGGYTNGIYYTSIAGGSIATWKATLPAPETYQVYAWMFTYPGAEASDDEAQYEVRAVQPHLAINLAGTGPQNYSDQILVNDTPTDWSVRLNTWSTTNPILINGDSALVTVKAVDWYGNVLKSQSFYAVGNRDLLPKSGSLGGNETWNALAGIYHLTSTVTVPAGVTLTLNPGTILRFASGASLNVAGTLIVAGTPEEPVEFYPHDGLTPWSIQVTGASGDLVMSNAHLVVGSVKINTGAAAVIADSLLEDAYDANGIIDADSGGSVQVLRTIVRRYAKISFDSTPATVDHCLLEDMTTTAVEFLGSANPSTVSRTTIRRPAGTDGIRFENSTAGLVERSLIESITGTGIVIKASTATVHGSLLKACDTGIAVSGASSATLRNNTTTGGNRGHSGSAAITNAIIWNATTSIQSGPAAIAYSDVRQPGTNVYAGVANMNRNPFFRLTMDGDYRLQSISPCVNSAFGGGNRGGIFPVGANPATPGNLQLTPSSNTVWLTWQDNSGDVETGFRIERSPDAGSTWQWVATTSANVTNYADTALPQLTPFAYRVQAVNNRGASFYSESAATTTTTEDYTQLLIDNLRITEIMYNQPGSDDAEFLEFKNISTNLPLNLAGLFTDAAPGETDSRFVFTNGNVIAPQGFFVLVRDPVAYALRYPGAPIHGVYQCTSCGLDNSGETLWVQDANSNDILRLNYADGWYAATDGDGYSLVPVDPNPVIGDPNQSIFWRASTDLGGSPGADDPNPLLGAIVINEILSHQDADNPGDWVELFNPGILPVDLSGWFLSDDATNLTKYTIPPASIVAAGDTIVFTEFSHFGAAFAFSELGDTLYVSSGATGVLTSFRISEDFGAADRNVTFGRYVRSDGVENFVAMSSQTMDAANAYPRVGPVVINEIMYNPAA